MEYLAAGDHHCSDEISFSRKLSAASHCFYFVTQSQNIKTTTQNREELFGCWPGNRECKFLHDNKNDVLL